jgi:hypothetical protein
MTIVEKRRGWGWWKTGCYWGNERSTADSLRNDRKKSKNKGNDLRGLVEGKQRAGATGVDKGLKKSY